MPQTTLLVDKLRADFPAITFTEGETSHWSHTAQTVFYCPNEPQLDWILLHELAHALLQHAEYQRDIELLGMERDAWEYARKQLAPPYNIAIDPDFIEDQLDTYRDWLHTKSTCPRCTLTGMEVRKHHYRCLGCQHTWKTNRGTQVRVHRYNQ